ncbi:hypothetical protein D3C72_2383790 [compost metagenome]
MDRRQAGGAVLIGARKQHAQQPRAIAVGGGLEQHIDRWPGKIHRLADGQREPGALVHQ